MRENNPTIIIDEYKGFKITRCNDTLRVAKINNDKLHTHLSSLHACYTVIDDMLNKKLPYKRSSYYLISLARISEDPEYIKKINEVIESRKNKNKKMNYYNKKGKIKKLA